MIKSVATFAWIVFLLALCVLVSGCGGGGEGGGPVAGPGVVLTAPQTNLAFGQSVNITASVPGQTDQTVVFSAPDGGRIQQTGSDSAIYTAPTAAGKYPVVAKADFDNSVRGTITFTVSFLGLSVSPTSAVLKIGTSVEFTGHVTGSANTAVTFSVSGGGTLSTVSSTTVKFTATANGAFTLTAKAAANPAVTATAQISVSPSGTSGATIGGRILEDTGTGLSGIILQFFDSGGNQVAQATTGAGGLFSVAVPVTAKRFNLLPSSINKANDYESFTYLTLRYDPLISTCTAPLPSLSSGASISLPGTISIPSTLGPPPPPPDGCGA